MFNITRIVSVLALCAAPLFAGPFHVENVVVLDEAPRSLRDGQVESNSSAFLFQESSFRATSDYAGDWGGFSAGTSVESWYMHFDPVGNQSIVDPDGMFVRFTFENEILGLDFRAETLDAGDALFGSDLTEYRVGEQWRGTELDYEDVIRIGEDRHTIMFDLKVWYANVDEFRILTSGGLTAGADGAPTPNPEPGTLVLCATAAALLIWRRRR